MLLGEDAAIVTDIEGTTRDVLEKTVPLGRVMLRLADTAGIREGENIDVVERIGIEKSREMIEKSELLFAIFDISRPFDEKDSLLLDIISESNVPKIAILNKSDKEAKLDESRLSGKFEYIIPMSMLGDGGENFEALCEIVDSLFTDEKIVVGEDAVLFSARQRAALCRGLEFVELAIGGLEAGFTQDAVSSDIELALGAVSELDGRAVSEEIVSDIFSKFCVGK